MIETGQIWLAAGIHEEDDPSACLMERVSLLLGQPKSYLPHGISPVVACVAGNVNDLLEDRPRQELVRFIPELLALASQPQSRAVDEATALWVLRAGLPSLPPVAYIKCLLASDEVRIWYRNRRRTWKTVLRAIDKWKETEDRWRTEGTLPKNCDQRQLRAWGDWLDAVVCFGEAVENAGSLRPAVRRIVHSLDAGVLFTTLAEVVAEHHRLLSGTDNQPEHRAPEERRPMPRTIALRASALPGEAFDDVLERLQAQPHALV